jgi:hypothetical protein
MPNQEPNISYRVYDHTFVVERRLRPAEEEYSA